MQLIPGRYFSVVRQIGNHTDTATYYVRAIVRDAYKDTILATLDLTDKGEQRFKKDWLVPQEPVGQGAFISIVTSVYTDSGYTTKSENYSDEENTYLWAPLQLGHVGGGVSVDYRRIGEMIDTRISAIPPVPPFPKIPTPKEYKMRWDEVLAKCDEMMAHMKSMPQEPMDDMPMMEKMDNIIDMIRNKEVTPPTDISSILDKLSADTDTGELNHEEVKGMIDESQKEILKKIPSEVMKALKKVKIITAVATHFSVDGKNLSFGKAKNEQEAEYPIEEKSKTEEVDHIGIANSLSS